MHLFTIKLFQDQGALVNDLINGHNCQELDQPLHRHEDGLVRSRIDRVYINQHPIDFLDKTVQAWVSSFPLRA